MRARFHYCGWTVISFLVLGIAGWLHAGPATTAPAPALSDLQQQRVATLQQAADLAQKMYEQGAATIGETFRVQRLLLDAQLEAATSTPQRVQLLQKALAVARQQEQLTSSRHSSGVAGPLEPLEAKAERLRLEIELVKAGGQTNP